MTLTDIATVLGVSAGVLLLTAAVVGTHAASTGWRRSAQERPIAWTAFALSMVLIVAATWVGVLA